MIIQCKQCRTKFRFDETKMEGDGVWMRCSRCQHVFFQDNPLKAGVSTSAPQVSPVYIRQGPQEKSAGSLSFEPDTAPREGSAADEDVRSFLRGVMTPDQTESAEPQSKAAPAQKAGVNLTDIEFSPGAEETDEIPDDLESLDEQPAPPVRRKTRWWLIALWSLLVIIVIPAALLYFVFPQQLDRYVQISRKYTGAAQPLEGQSVVSQVKLQDIRQRVLNNYVLGTIRIVEGSAVNQADYSISRIQVKAEILDAYSVVLGQRVNYAGNVLSDEDLVNLSEEEIQKRLSQPEGRDNSNERVVPHGRIPFMIVFTRDQSGTIKTTVSVAGAEKLL